MTLFAFSFMISLICLLASPLALALVLSPWYLLFYIPIFITLNVMIEG